MSSIKSIAIVGLLGALSVAIYMKIVNGPEPEPPAEFSGTWGEPPTIEMPEVPSAGLAGPTPGMPASPGGSALSAPDTGAPPWSATTPGAPTTAAGHDGASAEPNPDAPAWPGAGPESNGAVGSITVPPEYPSATPAGNPYTRGITEPSSGVAATVDRPGTATATNAGASTYAEIRRAAQVALDEAALPEALLLLSRWYDDPSLSPAQRGELTRLLSQLAGTVIYSTEHHLEPAYVVQPGDTLQTVAQAYDVPPQLLARINGIATSDPLTPGQELKVMRGPFAAIISLSDRELTLRIGGHYAGRFPVGIGTERQNMEGHWVVKHKLTNPTYYGRDRVIDADDPSNPLGEHWLGLASAKQQSTVEPFGIHGSYDAQSVHRDDPRGYVRLAPGDAEDVFDILSIGSKVMIRR